MTLLKKPYWIVLLCIILFGGITRLYRFNGPIADWHSWRQSDTAAVSRNFIQFGFDLLHPRYYDISNVQSGFDNPHGYRMVEFPLYNLFQAGLFQFIGIFSLEEWGRIVSIVSSLLIIVFLFLLGRRHANLYIALLSAFFYACTPYNIYYNRTILPDTAMAMTILGGIYFFDRWVEEKSQKKAVIFFISAILCTAMALLLKPYAVFFIIPMLYLAWKRWGFGMFRVWQLWLFPLLSLVPFLWWRLWIRQYPEGIPASLWLLNGNGIRFRPSFFKWIVYERVTKLISGYAGILLLAWGLFSARKLKQSGFFYAFLVSSLLYVCVFATGNVQHDYYQILIMPTIALFYGIGAYYLGIWKLRNIPVGTIVVGAATLIMFFYSWQQIKDYFNINNPSIVIAGKAIDRIIPKNAKVVAPYGGDTTLLYQIGRQGWPSFEHPLPDLIQKGADFLVLVNPKPADYGIGKSYKIIAATPDFILFNLHQKP